MGKIFKAPKMPKAPKIVQDLTELPELSIPLPEDGGANARRRIAQSQGRVGRSALRIPAPGAGLNTGR